jgi:DNA-binding GntR family transcriptional regulator
MDLARLRGLVDEITRATAKRNDSRVVDLNMRFHFAIWHAAQSPRLLKLMEDLQVSVQRFQRSTLRYPGRLEQARQEHTALLEAIVARRGDDAERIAREHMQHVRDIRIAMAAQQTRSRDQAEI